MARAPRELRRRGSRSAVDLEVELDRIAAMNIVELRDLWRRRHGQPPPEALSKDLIARALAHAIQEANLGGLDPHVRNLLAALSRNGSRPTRHVKIGSVIVREHQGQVHEVLIVPGGFCWQGKTYSSLSTIAKAITGTSWNGPRFFGLRGAGAATEPGEDTGTVPEASSLAVIAPAATLSSNPGLSKAAPARRRMPASVATAHHGAERGGGL
jgi:hypothetical protein